MDVTTSYFGAAGARHFVINSADNVYILPDAVQAVSGPPPSVTSVQPVGDGTVFVNGANLSAQSRIVFDGVAGTIDSVVSSHQLIVTPPLASPGFVGHVEALNPDGQSSLYISGDSGVQTYTWPGLGAPSLSVTSETLPAGQSVVVDVIGTNTNFVQGQTTVGFGTSSVGVTSVTVLHPHSSSGDCARGRRNRRRHHGHQCDYRTHCDFEEPRLHRNRHVARVRPALSDLSHVPTPAA